MDIRAQVNNEYLFAVQHTTENIQTLMPELYPHVCKFADEVSIHYSKGEFNYTTKDGVEHFWQTKFDRYEYMNEMHSDRLLSLCFDLVVACIIKPRTTFTEVVGKIASKLKLETQRMKLETVSEMVAILSKTPFITVEYPRDSDEGVLMINCLVNLSEETKKYLANQRFILPSVIKPKRVDDNKDCGYQTIRDGIILGGKNHDFPVNLHHINRANSVALRIDDRIPRLVNPSFKEKDDETVKERTERYEQWKQLNLESVDVFKKLLDTDVYLTHKYDERGRTYSRGHHVHSQGDDYRKGSVELAHRELVRA